MSKRPSLPNKLKAPRKSASTNPPSSSWDKKTITPDIGSKATAVEGRRIKRKSQISTIEEPPSESTSEAEESKSTYRRKRVVNDFEGSLTDKLIESIRSGDNYPQRVPPTSQRLTTTKNVQFTSTEKAAKKKGARDRDSESWDWNKPGTKESLQILQGISKIKLEDWYPFYDFQHPQQRQQSEEAADTPEENATSAAVTDDDGEWEETLVYVDLEDVPDAENVFGFPSQRSDADKGDGVAENTGDGEEVTTETEVKIFNLDSELPVIMIGGKYLAGRWEDTVGTSLFFQKQEKIEENEENNDSQTSESTSSKSTKGLKNITKEPDIAFDTLFGEDLGSRGDGYKLVAKSMKVLKAKQFAVANEELKGEDVIRDADNEYDPRDFQIPPANMLRQFYGPEINYESYMEKDLERRRKIRERWAPEKEKEQDNGIPFIKPEPIDQPDYVEDEYFDCDSPTIVTEDDDGEMPSTSKSIQR